MTIRSFLSSVALACALVASKGVSAQLRPGSAGEVGLPTGLIVGVNVTGSLVTVDEVTVDEHSFGGRGREGGGGMHFTLGYGFTPRIAVLLHGGGVMLSEDEERVIGGVDLAVRYSFAEPSHALVPYLEMAVGGGALEQDSGGRDGSELTGGSMSVAAGFNFFLTPRVALNTDFRYNTGLFTRISRGGHSIGDSAGLGFSTSRVNLGFNWYPTRPKSP